MPTATSTSAPALPSSLSQLKPSSPASGKKAFDAVAQKYHWVERINHVHTAGNSSGIVDGAALVLIGSEALGERTGLRPRARIVSAALSGADPTIMLTGPGPAVRKALGKAGMTIDQIDLVEINEAFAAVPLKFMKDFGVAREGHVSGGAITMDTRWGPPGHDPGHLVDELDRRNQRYGLATLCVAVAWESRLSSNGSAEEKHDERADTIRWKPTTTASSCSPYDPQQCTMNGATSAPWNRSCGAWERADNIAA